MPETDISLKQYVKYEKRKPQSDLSSFVFGKVPPQARELEEAVLGALMIERDALTETIEILRHENFYVESHQHIYKAILNLFEKSQPVDILTVTEELKRIGKLEEAGGAYYITELSHKVASSAHIVHHSHIIMQKYIQRELIRISSEVIRDSYEDTTDVFELLDKAEQNLFAVTEQNLKRNYSSMGTLISKTINHIESLRDQTDGLTGVPTGFNELDQLTGGWQKSDLVIIAARPGMGKTAFTLSIARNAAVMHKKAIAFFSLEMSAQQLVTRLIASEVELEGNKLRKGQLKDYEWHQLSKRVDKLIDAPMFIDDTPALTIFDLRAKCRRLKMQHNIDLIIVDYLQLMNGSRDNKGGNREQEIGSISRALKSLAKELDVPVIALSQLSRDVEKRGGEKKPQLSDLRESGSIEQDADMVIFLYRPEYYGQSVNEENIPFAGLAEIIVAKHRNGALQNVNLKYIPEFIKFVNPDNDFLPQRNTHYDQGDSNSGIITRSSRMDDMEDDDEELF